MTRRHVVATGGFQRGGVPADGHPSRGATHRASHEHGLHRHMEIDEHGWLQENARDTPTPPTQPTDRAERESTAFAGSGNGQHGFIVLVRVRQTRTGLRTDGHDGDRPSVADADEHPCQTPNRRRLASQSSTRGSGRPTAGPEQIRAAAQEEHREEQRRDLRECRRRGRHHFHGACRRTVQVTKPGTARSRGRGPQTCTPCPFPNRRPPHRYVDIIFPVCPRVVVGRV